MSITPFNFHQIQHPAPVLNAELQGLFETGIGIKIWPSIDGEMTLNIECRIAVSALYKYSPYSAFFNSTFGNQPRVSATGTVMELKRFLCKKSHYITNGFDS